MSSKGRQIGPSRRELGQIYQITLIDNKNMITEAKSASTVDRTAPPVGAVTRPPTSDSARFACASRAGRGEASLREFGRLWVSPSHARRGRTYVDDAEFDGSAVFESDVPADERVVDIASSDRRSATAGVFVPDGFSTLGGARTTVERCEDIGPSSLFGPLFEYRLTETSSKIPE